MTRHDRDARKLIVCSVCKYDQANIYRNRDGAITVVCSSCGHEMLKSQEAAHV